MVTNKQLKRLSNKLLSKQRKTALINRIKKIRKFVEDTNFKVREPKRPRSAKDQFRYYNVFRLNERFYSFEKEKDDLHVRLTYKMGDYNIAPNVYVLLRFDNPNLTVELPEAGPKDEIGSNASAVWMPSAKNVELIAYTLAISDRKHKDSVLNEVL